MIDTPHRLDSVMSPVLGDIVIENEACKSLLDPSYRTMVNNTVATEVGSIGKKLPMVKNKIRFTSVDDIDRNVKKANINAMNYYVSTKSQEIKKTLLTEILSKYILRDHPEIDPSEKCFVSDGDLKELPIEVVIEYSRGITNYKNACLLHYTEQSFSGYIKSDAKTNRYLYLEHNETGDRSLKKIENRYCDSYRDKIVKRMNWLMWRYGNENCCLLTLTIDPKKYNYDKFEMWKAISKKFKRFIEKLTIYFKRHNRPFPPYLWGIEAMYGRPENDYMSRGNPHLHVCLFNCKYVAPAETLEEYWGQGFIKINSTAKNEKIRYPIHYITKYITSTFTNNSPDNTLVQGLVWIFNKHSFDHSAGLTAPLYPKGSGDWSLSGIVTVQSGCSHSEEVRIIQELMYSLFGGFKDPPPVSNYEINEIEKIMCEKHMDREMAWRIYQNRKDILSPA